MQEVSGLVTGVNNWLRVYPQKILFLALVQLIFSFQSYDITLHRNSSFPFPQEDSKAFLRGDTSSKKIALVFTGHEFADGGDYIAEVLKKNKVKASFFLTGDFY